MQITKKTTMGEMLSYDRGIEDGLLGLLRLEGRRQHVDEAGRSRARTQTA